MSRLPTLFLSQGPPRFGLQPSAAAAAWRALSEALPRPRAVLVASSLWETTLPMLGSGERPRLIHDPAEPASVRYDVRGAPAVAQEAAGLLRDAGFTPALNGCRGLDRGAWGPLRRMYPRADVPVLQLSIQTALGAAHHLRLGEALAPLAGRGVLILGSGQVAQDPRDQARSRFSAGPLDDLPRFAEWLHERLVAQDRDAVLAYRDVAPGAASVHPTEAQLLPLLVAWGAAASRVTPRRVTVAVDGVAPAMDAYVFH